jgi:phosphatidylglycerophosphate synthase
MKQLRSAVFQPRAVPLAAWSRAQALAMTLSLGVCTWQRTAWPVVVSALCLFACLLMLGRGAHTPNGRFGFANAVTCIRLLVLLTLGLPPRWLVPTCALTITLLVLALDLLDGWLARRFADASAFGAHFDMETDALLVLIVTLRLWLGQGYPAWVLISGCLRYAYVLWLWAWPGPAAAREAPRSRLGRWAFTLLMLGLCLGLVLPGYAGRVAVALGTLVVSSSFARSGYFSRVAS